MTDKNFSDIDHIFNIKQKDITDTENKPIKKTLGNKMDFNIDAIEINGDFKKAIEIMESTFENVFITGDAGTGKSTLINYFKTTTKKRVVSIAPTGVAAVNIGGQTIHSFFRFPPKPMTASNIPILKPEDTKIYDRVDTIIIDEISMVRVDLMDAIDMFLRYNLHSEEPFAGKQIIMVGDLNQLPPVVGRGEEKEMIMHKYKSEYFFDASVWNKVGFEGIKLTKIYRQKDLAYIEILNKIKDNTISQIELDSLNDKCYNGGKMTKNEDSITLCSTNSVAEHINEMRLSKIHGNSFELVGDIVGNVNIKNCAADEIIYVKEGCRVMMLSNDPVGRWHNGTVGILKAVIHSEDKLEIEIGDKIHTIDKVVYNFSKYKYDRANKDITTEDIGTFTQYPIKVAYAITIHKSQGKTFDHMCLDTGMGTFAHGQLYVALSRCSTMMGVELTKKLSISDVIFDKRIAEFNNKLNNGKIGGIKQ
jgi:ATP-dependent DNA helicase PIF1